MIEFSLRLPWRYSLLAMILAALAPALNPAAEPRPQLTEKIDAIVHDAGVTAATPGVAVMVIDRGQAVFTKGYGLARLADRTPITPRTTFELASMTKMFTAAAIMILHDRNRLSLDDDIRKFLPELPVYFKDQPATITHLLQHTSGLPDYLAFPSPRGKHPGFVTSADYVAEFARLREKFPPRFKPGQRFEYQNSNFMLLAVVIERITRKSYGEFLRSEVLRPLGMKESWVYESPASAPRVEPGAAVNALAYRKGKKDWEAGWGSPPFRAESLLAVGDGGLWTSLEDLGRWDEALRKGSFIKPATLQLAFAPSHTRDGNTNDYGFGFGLTLQDDKVVAIGHNGAWVFQTLYHRDLIRDRSIVLLSNRDGFPVERIQNQIEKLLAQ
jgi:CubicO group peptidase (beta-lactamase class C family)